MQLIILISNYFAALDEGHFGKKKLQKIYISTEGSIALCEHLHSKHLTDKNMGNIV